MTTEQSQLLERGPVEPAAAPGTEPETDSPPRLRPINRQQLTLAPLDVEELIPADHKARAIWDLVGRLNLTPYLSQIQSREGGSGRPAWDPRLLVSVWVYALSEGMPLAREIERAMAYEPGLRWLTGLQIVNHHTLSDFALQGGETLQGLFVQLLGLLEAEQLINLDRVMHDGTRIRAQASGDSFRREKTLREHLERARQVVQQMGEGGEAPPAEGSRREAARRRAARERQQKVEHALEQLEQLQKEKANEAEKEQARASLTDPEARVMRQSDGGFAPAYNVQISTEAGHRIIVGVRVTQNGSDYQQLEPALQQMQQNLGRAPRQMVVDGGYCSAGNIVALAEKQIDLIGTLADRQARSQAAGKRLGIDPRFGPPAFRVGEEGLRCPAGKVLRYVGDSHTHGHRYRQYRAWGPDCMGCEHQPKCCPRHPERGRLVSILCQKPAVTAFREKMATPEAQRIYRQRAVVAESPHAWIKEKFGIRQFRVRGLVKVGGEALWACLTYNVVQWIRWVWRKPQVAAA